MRSDVEYLNEGPNQKRSSTLQMDCTGIVDIAEPLMLRVAWVRQTSNTFTENSLEHGYQKCQRYESEMSYRSCINSEPGCGPDIRRADESALQKGTCACNNARVPEQHAKLKSNQSSKTLMSI